MRRLKVTLLVLAAMLAMLTMTAVPALAVNTDDCHNRPGPFIRCGNDRFVNVDRVDDGFNRNNDCFDGFNCGLTRFNHFNDCFDGFNCGFDNTFHNGFGFFDDNCPFAGDREGIVNEFDC